MSVQVWAIVFFVAIVAGFAVLCWLLDGFADLIEWFKLRRY